MRLILLVWFVLLVNIIKSQNTFTYAYSDPCTGVLKTLEVPKDGITVTYYGEINTFSQSQILNGEFQSWAQNVYSSYGGNNPCGSVIGLPGTLSIAQDVALNSISILNSLSAAADLQAEMQGMTDIMAAAGSANTASNKKEKNNDQNTNTGSQASPEGNNSNNQPDSHTGNSSTPDGNSTTEGGNSTNPDKSTEGGNQSSESSVTGNNTENNSTTGDNSSTGGSSTNNSTGGSNNPNSTGKSGIGGEKEEKAPDTKTDDGTEEKKSSNLVGGAANSIQKSTEKNGPTTILSSDFTGFNFKNNDMTYGGKVTGGFTSMRWDGKRTHGFLLDYTSALKGPNGTAFYAFLHKKRIDLISGTATLSFYGKGSLYGTLALGQLWTLKKNLKVIYLATTSWGQVYQAKFTGTAFIAGGMYDWKATKKIDIKFTGLFIYAPFISYYNDLVLKSPYVVMPLVGTNIKITKKFKFNVNMGGTYAIKQNVMNFTIMCGTRFAI